MKTAEVAEEYAKRESLHVEDGEYTELTIEQAFIHGAEFMQRKAVEVYLSLCPSYKIHQKYECGNYSHRIEWKTKACNMNCEYMKLFLERL